MLMSLYRNIHAKKKRIAAGSGEKCVDQALKVRQLRQILNVPLKQQKRKGVN